MLRVDLTVEPTDPDDVTGYPARLTARSADRMATALFAAGFRIVGVRPDPWPGRNRWPGHETKTDCPVATDGRHDYRPMGDVANPPVRGFAERDWDAVHGDDAA